MTVLQQNKMVGLVGIALAAGAACHAATEYTSERYDVILDRSPFGSDPLSTVSTPNANAQAQATVAALEKAYRLSFLLESETGQVRAGFQNLKPKKGEPISSVIMVDESFMGMKLKSIDMVNSLATLEHNGKPVTFQLSKAPEQAKAVPVRPTSQSSRRLGSGFRRTQPAKQATPPQPKLSPEEQLIRREEIRKNLQDYQMEVIRKGMPPLPVPLTKEMDDQLVNEGVLPPAAAQ